MLLDDLGRLIRDLVREEVARALAEEHRPEPAPAEYLTAAQCAELVGLSTETLKLMRLRAEGPPFHRVARRAVRYARADVEAWLAARRVGRW